MWDSYGIAVYTINHIVVYFSKMEGCMSQAESKGEGHLVHFSEKEIKMTEVCPMLTEM